MDLNLNFLDTIAIRPNSIVFYHKNLKPSGNFIAKDKSLANLKDNAHKGVISYKVGKKIKNSIDWLLEMSKNKKFRTYRNNRSYKFKVNFITLTLQSKQIHSDQVIKHDCLNQFLIEAKKRWGLKHYIWKAESQKNDRIHFHLTTDTFIPHTKLRDTWNRICGKLGYIHEYQKSMKKWHKDGFKVRTDLLKNWSLSAQKKAYKRGMACDWLSPNSTDVHKVRQIADLPTYLKKYYCKKNENRAINGRLWGISRNLGAMSTVIIDSSMLCKHNVISFINSVCDRLKQDTYYAVLYIAWKDIKYYFDACADYLYKDYISYFDTNKTITLKEAVQVPISLQTETKFRALDIQAKIQFC